MKINLCMLSSQKFVYINAKLSVNFKTCTYAYIKKDDKIHTIFKKNICKKTKGKKEIAKRK